MTLPRHLCDTNILSELARPEPDAGVLAWADSVASIAISVITVEEIYYGLSWKPKARILRWFEGFLDGCTLLPVTVSIAKSAGELRGGLQARGSSRTQADLLIAATAKEHGLVLVTRNLRDFDDLGISLLNPFEKHDA